MDLIKYDILLCYTVIKYYISFIQSQFMMFWLFIVFDIINNAEINFLYASPWV